MVFKKLLMVNVKLLLDKKLSMIIKLHGIDNILPYTIIYSSCFGITKLLIDNAGDISSKTNTWPFSNT